MTRLSRRIVILVVAAFMAVVLSAPAASAVPIEKIEPIEQCLKAEEKLEQEPKGERSSRFSKGV